MAWGIGTPPAIHAVNICGTLETVYYSTGGDCVVNCNLTQQCFGDVSGTVVRTVPGHCFAC